MADVPTTCAGEPGGDVGKARHQADENDDPVVGYWCDTFGNLYTVERNDNTYSVTIEHKQGKNREHLRRWKESSNVMSRGASHGAR